jgi:hypothetical protein
LLKKADPLLRGILKDEEIKRLEGEEQFGKKLILPIVQLVAQMGDVEKKKVKEFVVWLYELAALTIYFENTLSVNRKTVPTLRQSRERYHRALIHVRHSLTELAQAEKVVQTEIASGLKKNLLDVRSPRSGLLRLEKNIMKLEGMMAAMIKPDLRTRKEQERVTSSPRKFGHLDLPAKEWSKALRSLVAASLEDELKRFTGGKGADQAIYEFISKFFGAIGYSETWSNVKTMLYRKRAEEKQSELSTAEAKNQALKR